MHLTFIIIKVVQVHDVKEALEFCKVCYKSIIPLPRGLTCSPHLRSNHTEFLQLILTVFFLPITKWHASIVPFWFLHVKHYLLTSSCNKYKVDFLSYPSPIHLCHICTLFLSSNSQSSYIFILFRSIFSVDGIEPERSMILAFQYTFFPGVSIYLWYGLVWLS